MLGAVVVAGEVSGHPVILQERDHDIEEAILSGGPVLADAPHGVVPADDEEISVACTREDNESHRAANAAQAVMSASRVVRN